MIQSHRKISDRLRALLKAAPPVQPAARLSEDEAVENYLYRLGDEEHGKNDPIDLILRVLQGVKPMASIMLKGGRHIRASARVTRKVALGLGLGVTILTNRWGIHEAIVYQKGVTLSTFYDPDTILARYSAIGIKIPPDFFYVELGYHARELSNEDFEEELKLPLIGLCYGYPISETLELIDRYRP